MHVAAQSHFNATSDQPTSIEAQRARLIVKGTGRLLEDLADLVGDVAM
jgi:hypothetical protein